MITVETNGKTLLFVEVPEDANGFRISKLQGDSDLIYPKNGGFKFVCSLPLGNYQILGKSTELSKEQMKELCEHCKMGYFNYKNPFSSDPSKAFTNSLEESYLSLLEANGIVDRNKYEKPEIYHDDGIREPCKYDYPHGFDIEQYRKDETVWQEAQSKVKTYLILIKK